MLGKTSCTYLCAGLFESSIFFPAQFFLGFGGSGFSWGFSSLASTLLSLVCRSRLSASTSSLFFIYTCRSTTMSLRSSLMSSRSPLMSSRSLLFSSSSFFSDCLRSLISSLFLCSMYSLSSSTPSNPSKRCVVFDSLDHVLDRCSSVDSSR